MNGISWITYHSCTSQHDHRTCLSVKSQNDLISALRIRRYTATVHTIHVSLSCSLSWDSHSESDFPPLSVYSYNVKSEEHRGSRKGPDIYN